MELDEFVARFAEQFDETDPDEITAQTMFHELEEYTSLIALSIMAMVDEEYDVQLRGEDLRNAASVQDLFNVVNTNKG